MLTDPEFYFHFDRMTDVIQDRISFFIHDDYQMQMTKQFNRIWFNWAGGEVTIFIGYDREIVSLVHLYFNDKLRLVVRKNGFANTANYVGETLKKIEDREKAKKAAKAIRKITKELI